MYVEWLFAYSLKLFFIFTSPITLLVGIFLLYDINTYQRIEKMLAKSYGLPKGILSSLEKNRASLQMYLLKKRRIIGVVCILNSLVALFISLFSLKGYR